MTTIDYLVTGFKLAGVQRRNARAAKRAQIAGTTKAAAKSIQQRIGDVWLSLIGASLGCVAAWQYATWAGLLTTALGCVVAEKLLRIGD